jgi:hypothetical protein
VVAAESVIRDRTRALPIGRLSGDRCRRLDSPFLEKVVVEPSARGDWVVGFRPNFFAQEETAHPGCRLKK